MTALHLCEAALLKHSKSAHSICSTSRSTTGRRLPPSPRSGRAARASLEEKSPTKVPESTMVTIVSRQMRRTAGWPARARLCRGVLPAVCQAWGPSRPSCCEDQQLGGRQACHALSLSVLAARAGAAWLGVQRLSATSTEVIQRLRAARAAAACMPGPHRWPPHLQTCRGCSGAPPRPSSRGQTCAQAGLHAMDGSCQQRHGMQAVPACSAERRKTSRCRAGHGVSRADRASSCDVPQARPQACDTHSPAASRVATGRTCRR